MNKKGQSVETKFSILFFSRDDTVFSPGVAACVLALLLCVYAVCKVLCFILPSEMNITGTLPQAENLKLFVPSLSTQSSTRPKQNMFNDVLMRPDKTE